MSELLQAVGFGLVTASIVALAAVAVSLQVSVTNFFNFAFGDFMTFGAYVAWTASSHAVAGSALPYAVCPMPTMATWRLITGRLRATPG